MRLTSEREDKIRAKALCTTEPEVLEFYGVYELLAEIDRLRVVIFQAIQDKE